MKNLKNENVLPRAMWKSDSSSYVYFPSHLKYFDLLVLLFVLLVKSDLIRV